MQWKQPPVIKIYEALGAVADGRVKDEHGEIHIYSSSGNKHYTVTYDAEQNAIMCNDNGSYWQGYLGYPAVTYLMTIGVISFDPKWAQALQGIAWKDVNQELKNDFEKTAGYCHGVLIQKGHDVDDFLADVAFIDQQIENLKLEKLGKRTKPPTGY